MLLRNESNGDRTLFFIVEKMLNCQESRPDPFIIIGRATGYLCPRYSLQMHPVPGWF